MLQYLGLYWQHELPTLQGEGQKVKGYTVNVNTDITVDMRHNKNKRMSTKK